MAFPTISSQKPLTHRAFFRDLPRASVREEFVEGVVYPRPSVGPVHQRVLANVVNALAPQVKGSPCTLYQDTMVGRGAHIESTPPGEFSYATSGAFVMPDLVVVLDRPEYFVPSNSIIVNPTVILEVLSPGEQDFACGIRFEALRQWLDPAFCAYVLIASEHAEVAVYTRRGRDDWALEVLQATSAVLTLPRVGVTLTLAEVYAQVRDRAGRPFVGAVCPHCGKNVF